MGSFDTGCSCGGALSESISLLHLALVRRLLVHARNQYLRLRPGVRKRLVVDAATNCLGRAGLRTSAGRRRLLRQLQLLRRRLVAGVNLQRARKLIDRAAHVARLPQHASAVDVLHLRSGSAAARSAPCSACRSASSATPADRPQRPRRSRREPRPPDPACSMCSQTVHARRWPAAQTQEGETAPRPPVPSGLTASCTTGRSRVVSFL